MNNAFSCVFEEFNYFLPKPKNKELLLLIGLLPLTCLDAFALSPQLSADSAVIWLGGAFSPLPVSAFLGQDGCHSIVVTHDVYEMGKKMNKRM